MLRIPSLFLSVCFLASCSGGGSSSSSLVAQPTGAVELLIDTATGTPALIQVQVAAVSLEDAAGTTTGNLLSSSRMITLADPTGEPEGLMLDAVASGDYRIVHLGIVPGSGFASYPDGTKVAVTTGADLQIPLAEPVSHHATRNTWILCGHDGVPPPASAQSAFSWNPRLRGRVPGSPMTLPDLDVLLVANGRVTVRNPRFGTAPLFLDFAPGCLFLGSNGQPFAGSGMFFAQLQRGHRVSVEGTIYEEGDVVVSQVRSHGVGNTGPRLIGRITSIDAGTDSFVMDVFAEGRRGGPSILPLPSEARVITTGSRIEHSNGTPLSFGALAVQQLVKVTWLTRIVTTNGPEEVTASEVEVSPAGGAGMDPQWEGSVQSVDLNQRTIAVVPRHNDPIYIQGVAQNPVTVHVGQGVPIQRHEPGPNGRTWITLDQVVGGRDRIWFRGTVSGPASIDASWLRVRDDS